MTSLISRIAIPGYIVFTCCCCKGQPSILPAIDQKALQEYWYKGKAEVSSFDLNQSHYGAQHDGNVILIFVTEDMSKSREVKLDDPMTNASDDIKVLKMNMNKDFVTGLYKYSMMSSVFTPLDYAVHPHSLKLTASSQDWLGQSFMQLNWKENRYDIQQFSYFESEGDTAFPLIATWLEDEIWTKIRVAPNTLPIGKVTMIPSAFYIRLTHQPEKIYDAITALKREGNEYRYTIEYPELKRTMEITFQNGFPYRITGWKETYGDNEVTTAHLTSTIMSDYWKHNQPQDEILREELKLRE